LRWNRPNLGKVVFARRGQAEGPAMTSPDALTDLLDTYMDLLGLLSIMVVVVWLGWEAFR
jgi:hypothetical protein